MACLWHWVSKRYPPNPAWNPHPYIHSFGSSNFHSPEIMGTCVMQPLKLRYHFSWFCHCHSTSCMIIIWCWPMNANHPCSSYVHYILPMHWVKVGRLVHVDNVVLVAVSCRHFWPHALKKFNAFLISSWGTFATPLSLSRITSCLTQSNIKLLSTEPLFSFDENYN